MSSILQFRQRRACVLGALALVCLAGLLPTAAAQRPHDRPRSRPPIDFFVHRMIGGDVLRPSPQDFGPVVDDDEFDDLQRFTRTHLPSLYRHMHRLKQHDEQAYQRHMSGAAPRLRHLQRVFSENPRLGRLMRQHIESSHKMGERQRALRRARSSASERRATQQLRESIGALVRLETAILETRVDALEREGESRQDDFLAYLFNADSDLSAAPERIRNAMERYHDGASEFERTKMRDRMTHMVQDRYGKEVRRLRERTKMLRKDPRREIDNRVERVLRRIRRAEDDRSMRERDEPADDESENSP